MSRRRTAQSWRALLVAAATGIALLVPGTPGTAVPGPPNPPQSQQASGPGQPAQDPPPVWSGVPGTNQAYDSYGYPWPAAPDCDESSVGSGGCVNDGRGFFQGQCTSWVAFRLSQRNGISFSNWYDGAHWGDAVDWRKVAKGLGYTSDEVPAVGAIGWYARGHVSYVEEVNSDGSIVISEMNIDGHNGFHLVTVVPGGAGWPDKFLHVADVVPVDYTAPERPEPVALAPLGRAVRVSWKVPADDIGVTGYRVLRNGMPLAETSDPAYVDRQASPGQVYTYSVEAYDAAGNVSQPATAVRGQGTPAPAPLRGRLQHAVLVEAGATTAVCGLAGDARDQRVACRFRTLDGWRTVRTGREVPWGRPQTGAFVASGDALIWFCRELAGGRNACLPLDLTGPGWGFDRVDVSRPQPADATWVATRSGPVRCGIAGDRPTCLTLGGNGWKGPRRDHDARPGDPLSRAFLPTADGAAFCRSVEGRPTCTVLEARSRHWGRAVVDGRDVPHGRWVSRSAGPALCPVERGECLVVG